MKKGKNILIIIVILTLSLTVSCRNAKTNENSNPFDSTLVENSKNHVINWEFYDIEDEFGDKTQEKYLGVNGKGKVSVDANRIIDMTVYLFIRHDEVFFKFHLEDLQYVCHDNYPITMNIKDSDGKIYQYEFICKKNGEICLKRDNEQTLSLFMSIIEKGGVISGSTQIYSSPYTFKVDVSGYKDAVKEL